MQNIREEIAYVVGEGLTEDQIQEKERLIDTLVKTVKRLAELAVPDDSIMVFAHITTNKEKGLSITTGNDISQAATLCSVMQKEESLKNVVMMSMLPLL